MSVSGARNLLTHFYDFWPQKLTKITISWAKNSENGSVIFPGPETDIMVQFLAPKTDIMGVRKFMSENITASFQFANLCVLTFV